MEEVQRCYAGCPQTDLGRDLAEALARPPRSRARVARTSSTGAAWIVTIAALRHPRRPAAVLPRVASAVGLASIEIFGYKNPADPRLRGGAGGRAPAHQHPARLGLRCRARPAYIPLDDLARFQLSEADVLCGVGGRDPRRADGAAARLPGGPGPCPLHARARCSSPAGGPPGDVSAEVMGPSTASLLDEMIARGFDRSVPDACACRTARKAWIAARTWMKNRTAGRRREGRRRRWRFRRAGGGHPPPGAPARRLAAGAARRTGRTRDVVSRRGHRRRGRQRHARSGGGAYTDTIDLVRRASAEDLLLVQARPAHRLRRRSRLVTSLDCAPIAAPLHLLAGLLGLRVPWRCDGRRSAWPWP